MKQTCKIKNVGFGEGKLAVIAGPCMAESCELCMQIAEKLKTVCEKLDVGLVFKASFDKANRSSASGYRGPGIDTGLQWLAKVAGELDLPIISDIHETSQVAQAAEVLDALQIPAFLCRQTDLLVAAGESGKAVNIKKGQFMAPWDMPNAVEKVRSTGNNNVLLTDRGTSFGYNRLITDFRGIVQMQQAAPVVFDATHSVQEPGGLGSSSGGQRQFAPILAKAAMAVGADALFIETHPDPDNAKSDAGCQIPLDSFEKIIGDCLKIFNLVRSL